MILGGLKTTLRQLYLGSDDVAVRFRYALIAFDVATIAFFIVTMPITHSPSLIVVDTALGVAILCDFLARLWIASDKWAMLRRVYTIADVIVISSLLLLPFFSSHLSFLRVLRGLRLVHSYHLLRDLRKESDFFRRNEEAVIASVNLFVFIFFTSCVVFALFFERSLGYSAYIDALYFTVATLTTTGFGDITPSGPVEKLVTVVVMLVGVALFVQLARAVFKPSKIKYRCPSCALNRHDQDAIHCKHCGEPLRIETEGE